MGDTYLSTLARWRALDRRLYRGRLVISDFIESWYVDERTIRRDLKALAQLGHVAEMVVVQEGVKGGTYWRYKPGTRPLFAASLE